MAGGTVTETINVAATGGNAAYVWINCETGDDVTTAVCLEFSAAARCVQPGDTLTWKRDTALWTPKRLYFRDYKLKRIEGVNVRKPDAVKVTSSAGWSK